MPCGGTRWFHAVWFLVYVLRSSLWLLREELIMRGPKKIHVSPGGFLCRLRLEDRTLVTDVRWKFRHEDPHCPHRGHIWRCYGLAPGGTGLLLSSAWIPTSYDRDRDTFRQSRKTTTKLTASQHTTVTHTDAGGDLDGPVRQGPTCEAQRTQREKKEKQQTLRCHMKAELQACTHSSIGIANTPFPLPSSE